MVHKAAPAPNKDHLPKVSVASRLRNLLVLSQAFRGELSRQSLPLWGMACGWASTNQLTRNRVFLYKLKEGSEGKAR